MTVNYAPADTPEERQNQLISAAVDLAEKQLRDGTASPSVITHYLKLGTKREELEILRLQAETQALTAKAEAVSSNKRIEELYEQAIAAMRSYSGADSDNYDYGVEFYEDS